MSGQSFVRVRNAAVLVVDSICNASDITATCETDVGLGTGSTRSAYRSVSVESSSVAGCPAPSAIATASPYSPTFGTGRSQDAPALSGGRRLSRASGFSACSSTARRRWIIACSLSPRRCRMFPRLLYLARCLILGRQLVSESGSYSRCGTRGCTAVRSPGSADDYGVPASTVFPTAIPTATPSEMPTVEPNPLTCLRRVRRLRRPLGVREARRNGVGLFEQPVDTVSNLLRRIVSLLHAHLGGFDRVPDRFQNVAAVQIGRTRHATPPAAPQHGPMPGQGKIIHESAEVRPIRQRSRLCAYGSHDHAERVSDR